jgi:N4-gp56 family major capsid protein
MANTYGDISPRTAAYAAVKMLERALPHLSMARFGQQARIPKNKTNTIKFRRYNGFTPNTTALTEGVTPAADNISSTDVTATLVQYGRRTQVTDVIEDTHEDPVLNEYAEIMGELAGQTAELVVFNAIRAGTNVLYAGTANSRDTVNAAVDAGVLMRAIRQLKRQNAKLQTKMLAGTDRVGTMPIRAGYIAFVHPDVQMDLEAIPGFKPVAEYSTPSMLTDNELGAYKEIRFFSSTLYAPFLAAGTAGTNFLSNGADPGAGGNADVYPIIITGADSYATVSLAGADAVTPIVVKPKASDSDPLAQRGHVGIKMYGTAAVLNDAWMVRVEVAVNK